MMLRRFLFPLVLGFGLGCSVALAQGEQSLSLSQAQAIALQNHPRIASSTLTAQAGGSVVREVSSAFYPVLSANVTGVGTEHNAVLSAGAIPTSSIFNRAASGIVVNQLVTDFGRTASLQQSAQLRNASENQNISNVRAQVSLEVQQSYFQALASEAVLKVAQAILDLRRLTLRQVSSLAQSGLRSTLDVSFVEVTVSQAELDLFRAQNDAKASHARLSAAMGYDRDQPFTLVDEPLPSALNQDIDALIADALRDRPDLAALRLSRDSLARFAQAETRLRNPTIGAIAVAGAAPVRDDRLPATYSAAGINVNIPVLNGGLFRARREEAESRAAAAQKDVDDLSRVIGRDVRITWLDATNAFQRLDVTARMVAEAAEALRLAQARYDSALGSIVELNQAQLNQTSAEIAAASAKYEYLARRSALDYATGVLR